MKSTVSVTVDPTLWGQAEAVLGGKGRSEFISQALRDRVSIGGLVAKHLLCCARCLKPVTQYGLRAWMNPGYELEDGREEPRGLGWTCSSCEPTDPIVRRLELFWNLPESERGRLHAEFLRDLGARLSADRQATTTLTDQGREAIILFGGALALTYGRLHILRDDEAVVRRVVFGLADDARLPPEEEARALASAREHLEDIERAIAAREAARVHE